MKFAWWIGILLAGCASQPRPLAPGMVRIPAGPAWVGGNDSESFFQPYQQRQVAVFDIDIHEVTQAEYKKFRPDFVLLKGQENLPITHVTREEAVAYLASVGKRLPTALEWEKAARGEDGRVFPWGSKWDHRKGNLTANGRADSFCTLGKMKPVDAFPEGISPYGCLNMCGNAWEWVADTYQGKAVIRGGAYGYRERDCRSSGFALEQAGFT